MSDMAHLRYIGEPVSPERLARLDAILNGWKECANYNHCDRVVRTRGQYCCTACDMAAGNNSRNEVYEIHESGPLGHSEGCNARHAERMDGALP